MPRDVLMSTCFVDGRHGRNQFSWWSESAWRGALEFSDRDVPTLSALRMATLARILVCERRKGARLFVALEYI